MKPYYRKAHCPYADCLEQSLLGILQLFFFVGVVFFEMKFFINLIS